MCNMRLGSVGAWRQLKPNPHVLPASTDRELGASDVEHQEVLGRCGLTVQCSVLQVHSFLLLCFHHLPLAFPILRVFSVYLHLALKPAALLSYALHCFSALLC
jgi:hypothetical protein